MIGAPWKGRSGTNLGDFSLSKHRDEYRILSNLHQIKNVIVFLLSPPQQQFQHPQMFQMAVGLLNWTTCQHRWSVKHVGVTYFWETSLKKDFVDLEVSCQYHVPVVTSQTLSPQGNAMDRFLIWTQKQPWVSIKTEYEISTRGLVQYKMPSYQYKNSSFKDKTVSNRLIFMMGFPLLIRLCLNKSLNIDSAPGVIDTKSFLYMGHACMPCWIVTAAV